MYNGAKLSKFYNLSLFYFVTYMFILCSCHMSKCNESILFEVKMQVRRQKSRATFPKAGKYVTVRFRGKELNAFATNTVTLYYMLK